jgi:hypothetical protein
VSADYDVDAVLARVKRRRELNAERCAELGIDMSPEGVAASGAALLRDRIDKQRRERAEDAGQLDLGGAA